MESILSQLMIFGILLFLVIGSGVLFWDGLALSFGHGHSHGHSGGASVRLARVRMVFGLLGVALAVWLAAGYLTRVQ
jgi:hypothetical protein